MYCQTKIVFLARLKKGISGLLITGKESIQEPDTPSKREKEDSITDRKNKKTSPPFKNKEDYIGSTN